MEESRWEPDLLEGTYAQAMCTDCGRMFTTDGNFDRHRRRGSCVDPATVKLVLNDRGFWQSPGNRPF